MHCQQAQSQCWLAERSQDAHVLLALCMQGCASAKELLCQAGRRLSSTPRQRTKAIRATICTAKVTRLRIEDLRELTTAISRA